MRLYFPQEGNTIQNLYQRFIRLKMIRIGIGYDVHELVSDRKLILGGIDIPYAKGLKGHSDADVLIHAMIDAILGAANMGDIGTLFPDTDPTFKGISSVVLLKKVGEKLKNEKKEIGNIDTVIMAQKPKLSPYIAEMKKILADTLALPIDAISIKATTTEKLGFVGREEGIAAEAVALIHHQYSM